MQNQFNRIVESSLRHLIAGLEDLEHRLHQLCRGLQVGCRRLLLNLCIEPHSLHLKLVLALFAPISALFLALVTFLGICSAALSFCSLELQFGAMHLELHLRRGQLLLLHLSQFLNARELLAAET